MTTSRSRLDFGPLGFGAAGIGNLYRSVPNNQAFAALDAAWARGIRYYDTAPHYGLGLSERRLGAFLASKNPDDYLVSTKVGRLLIPNPHYGGGNDLANGFDVPNDLERIYDPSLSGVRRSIEESLVRMGIERIDIAYLHDPDVYDLEAGLTQGLPALIKLRDEGVVRAVGIGVNDAGVAARAVREYDIDVVMIAGRYTLLEQPAAAELLPEATARGVQIVAAAPYNSGLLSSNVPSGYYNYGEIPQAVAKRASALAAVCRDHGVDLPAAAIQFPLRHPAVDTVVVGTSRAEAVLENAARMQAPLPAKLWEDLAAVPALEG